MQLVEAAPPALAQLSASAAVRTRPQVLLSVTLLALSAFAANKVHAVGDRIRGWWF